MSPQSSSKWDILSNPEDEKTAHRPGVAGEHSQAFGAISSKLPENDLGGQAMMADKAGREHVSPPQCDRMATPGLRDVQGHNNSGRKPYFTHIVRANRAHDIDGHCRGARPGWSTRKANGSWLMIRLIGYFFGIGTVLFLVVAAGIAWYIGDVSQDLPDYEVLNSYEPPVTTRVHAASGDLMAEYARERRLFLPIQAIPRPGEGGIPLGRRQEFLSSPRR